MEGLFLETGNAWEKMDLRPAGSEITYEIGLASALITTELGIRRLRGIAHHKGKRQVRELFERLRAEWAEDTQFSSSLHQAATHPAYQRIVGLGEDALPLIFEQLREDPSPKWFWALRAIVREDKAATSETVQDAVEQWLSWAVEEGYA